MLSCNIVGCAYPKDTVKYGLCGFHRNDRRTCTVDDCDNLIVNRGVCIKHGAKKNVKKVKCKISGCKNLGKGSKQLCTTHSGNKYICMVEGCEKYARNMGVCVTHGCRMASCSVTGCTNRIMNNGVCFAHGAIYPPSAVCIACKETLTSTGKKMCLKCRIAAGEIIERSERLELKWLAKFIDWGYYPSVHDKIIKSSDCSVVNRRRVDYLFITPESMRYNVLVECDENSHNGHEVECEMTRLQDVQDQLIAQTNSLKPLVVIRFNPNYHDEDELDIQMKYVLRDVFRGDVDTNDDRGIIIHSVVCYSKKRKLMYDNSPVTKRITI